MVRTAPSWTYYEHISSLEAGALRSSLAKPGLPTRSLRRHRRTQAPAGNNALLLDARRAVELDDIAFGITDIDGWTFTSAP